MQEISLLLFGNTSQKETVPRKHKNFFEFSARFYDTSQRIKVFEVSWQLQQTAMKTATMHNKKQILVGGFNPVKKY